MLPRLWHSFFRTSYDKPARLPLTPPPSPVHSEVEYLSLLEVAGQELDNPTVVSETTESLRAKPEMYFTNKIKADKERFRPALSIQIPPR